MVGTTVGNLLDRVKRDANLGIYGPIYTLAVTVDADDVDWTVNEEGSHLTVGSTLSIGTELVRITAVAPGTGALTVARAQYASTAAAHTAGDVIGVDDRLPLAALWDYAEHELRSWRKQIFRIHTADIPVVRNERTYTFTPQDSTTEVDFLLDVRQEPNGTVGSFDDYNRTWTGDAWPKVEAQLLRNMPTADFGAGGYGIQLTTYPRFTTNLRVIYGTAFDLAPFNIASDLISDVGLEHNQLDVLEQGVRWRALQTGLVPRTDWRATGVLREPEQVTLLDVVRAIDMARSLRDRRFNEEALAIRSRFAYRRGP